MVGVGGWGVFYISLHGCVRLLHLSLPCLQLRCFHAVQLRGTSMPGDVSMPQLCLETKGCDST